MNPGVRTQRRKRSMNIFLIFAFLFFIGSVFGWVLELFYRRFFSRNNPERKWINPGFCIGPYLPLYGTGLCFLYLIASIQQYSPAASEPWHTIILIIVMMLTMTIIEYIAGFISLHSFHVRLWDYSEERANIQGIICPKFSAFWGILGTVYYYLVHPYILEVISTLNICILSLRFSERSWSHRPIRTAAIGMTISAIKLRISLVSMLFLLHFLVLRGDQSLAKIIRRDVMCQRAPVGNTDGTGLFGDNNGKGICHF